MDRTAVHAVRRRFYFSQLFWAISRSPAQQRGVTGVGLELYFKCWVAMKSGTTEAAGALFHCGARLVHPGSWSQDHLSTNGPVPPLVHIGRFGALLAQATPNRL